MTGSWDPAEGIRSLVEDASDVIMVLEPDLSIIFQTASVERLLGHPPAELVGTKFAALVHPSDLGRLRLACATTADGIRSGPVELRLRHRDGTWIDAETAVRHQADQGHLVLSTRDARERKRVERKLRRQASQQAVVAALGARALEGGGSRTWFSRRPPRYSVCWMPTSPGCTSTFPTATPSSSSEAWGLRPIEETARRSPHRTRGWATSSAASSP